MSFFKPSRTDGVDQNQNQNEAADLLENIDHLSGISCFGGSVLADGTPGQVVPILPVICFHERRGAGSVCGSVSGRFSHIYSFQTLTVMMIILL